jgi:hypothetical protein
MTGTTRAARARGEALLAASLELVADKRQP